MPKGDSKDSGSKYWYTAQGDTWNGPFSHADIVRRIQDGSTSWVDFVWSFLWKKDGWQRIATVEEFQAAMPKSPADSLIREIKSDDAAKGRTPNQRHSVWFLQFEGSEFGPLSLAEVQVILKSGKLKGRLFAWREGMPNWLPADQVAELTGPSAAKPVSETIDERRQSKRVALVATVRFALPDGSAKYTGVCRDISAQGLLIMSNHVPTVDVTRPPSFKLEVCPLGSLGFDPFTADVEVIRVLMDNSGFSVRFTQLSDIARRSIDKYLSRN